MSERPSSLGALLRRLADRLDGEVEAAYAARGLAFRPRYTVIMRALMEAERAAEEPMALSIKALAEAAGLTHSALSQTAAQMTREGWLVSGRAADGRQRAVMLSDQARAALPALTDQWRATKRAARSLDQDLGLELEAVLTAALRALEARGYRDRMEG